MNQKQIEEYCLQKKGADINYKPEWEATVGTIEGKMFVMLAQNNLGKDIVSLKCEPMLAEEYRKEYKDIIPGYYMNKVHWNSIYIDGEVPDKVIKDMIDMSYNLIFEKLPKKIKESEKYK